MMVITRFAPSPTGYLHIGGARTALFNWLYAKHTGGKMLLRIEDTDRERSTPEATQAILDGLKWLGLDWDGDVVYQSQRIEAHQSIAAQLVAYDAAYYWTDPDRPNDRPPIRIKAPKSGFSTIDDKVQGKITIKNDQLDDYIILRSDGTPTYMLAVVVDDHDMGVTHIIRGTDHLNNAFRQKVIYDAMGWEMPTMAHIPLIHGPDGQKMSKRHGATGVEEYRAMGYLPVAMRNYLARLSWSHGNDEFILANDLIKWFDLDAIGQSAARFDFDKLNDLNGQWMSRIYDLDVMAFFHDALPYIAPDIQYSATDLINISDAMPLLKVRAKTLKELVQVSKFLRVSETLAINEAAQAVINDNKALLFELYYVVLDNDWNNIEEVIADYAKKNNLKLGKVAQVLRAALTGTLASPGIFDVLKLLGRDISLSRIGDFAMKITEQPKVE